MHPSPSSDLATSCTHTNTYTYFYKHLCSISLEFLLSYTHKHTHPCMTALYIHWFLLCLLTLTLKIHKQQNTTTLPSEWLKNIFTMSRSVQKYIWMHQYTTNSYKCIVGVYVQQCCPLPVFSLFHFVIGRDVPGLIFLQVLMDFLWQKCNSKNIGNKPGSKADTGVF